MHKPHRLVGWSQIMDNLVIYNVSLFETQMRLMSRIMDDLEIRNQSQLEIQMGPNSLLAGFTVDQPQYV